MSAFLNMRTTRLPLFRPHQLKLAATLLCALAPAMSWPRPPKPTDKPAAPAAAAPAAAPAAAAAKPSTGFLPPAASNAHVIDSVYVIVNDEVITKREVDNRVTEITQRLRAQQAQMPAEEDLRRQVVEGMISERAQVQLAKEMGVRVDGHRRSIALDRPHRRRPEDERAGPAQRSWKRKARRSASSVSRSATRS